MASIRSDLSTGKRLYVQTRYGEPVVDRLKSLGAHWDAHFKCWWISPRKRASVEALLVDADQKQESGAEPQRKREDPDDIELQGKGRYKGKDYYVGRHEAASGKLHLYSLPNDKGEFIDFWADPNLVEVIKRYEPREVWDGRRYSGRTITVYQTLGGIAEYLREVKKPGPKCAECGRPGELVADLEDGILKHSWCCDMPPS
jgi:hypothetical protein